MLKLEGKTAVVTGGSSGIGLAIAELFVDEGAHVFIIGRRQIELDKAVAKIGRSITAVQGDVANLADLRKVFAKVEEERGSIDILAHNAGTVELKTIEEVTKAHFDRIFDVNVRGIFFATQKALPLFNDGGAIVLVASPVILSAFRPTRSIRPARRRYATSPEAGRRRWRCGAFASTR